MSGQPGRRTARGMVTAELAVAILAAFSLFLLLCWGLVLIGTQLRCVDTAAAVARQEARSDSAGVARARAEAPQGAVVRVDRQPDQVRVTVTLRSRPFARGLPAVPLRAEAVVVPEPRAPR
jgi:hypothetical protein